MRDTKVINLYGGPGTGKSTLAAKVFAHLKDRKISCELVQEFAKELVWEEDWDSLACQAYVTRVQHSRVKRLYGKVDYIISDSPISLGLIYGKDLLDAEEEVIIDRHKEFNNIKVFLTRHKDYDPEGRMQTYEEALECDKKILNLMSELYPDEEVKVFSNEADKSVKFLEDVLGLRENSD